MSDVGELERKCREAFKVEAGYEGLQHSSQMYRTFRDGFYAAYGVFVVAPLCKKDKESA